ncbi:hypothetical protein [Natronorubrum bangense]|uniref:Uncharacterized protein n=2 Tax=Natronorubrum bangense TaxID=61858 RepID=L9WK03_9EURY|nr:hypothetical protein [Natronorubrum bangense]ELY49789.1 hypothetical protein C494_07250 [Natronorubrum bangense JCM 10635]QCC55415.1 hypothetical protein DV706_13635 [Natronorubrum bangense]
MLTRMEQLTVALTGVFLGTLAVAVSVGSPVVWLAWGVTMVLLAGSALVYANRSDPPLDD